MNARPSGDASSREPGAAKRRRAATIAALAGLCMATTSTIVPASDALAKTPSTATSWYHDPVSSQGRKAETAIPATAVRLTGQPRHTKATNRNAAGNLAVPVRWTRGHQLGARQAALLDHTGLFEFDSAALTPTARKQLTQLARSLQLALHVRCEGYADFGGDPAHERALSAKRAQAVCDFLTARVPGLQASAVGLGSANPVVVGGTPAQRAQNRRVVVTVTRAAGAPTAPTLTSVTPGNGTATITFVARGPITPSTRYQVSTDGGAHWSTVPTTAAGRRVHRLVVTGLTNGKAYKFAVRAVNKAGHSSHSPVHSVTPGHAPQPPVTAPPSPTQPTQPPTQPTEPTVPTEPTLPTEPAQPTEPTLQVPGVPLEVSVSPSILLDGAVGLTLDFYAPIDGGAADHYEVSLDNGLTWRTLSEADDFGQDPRAMYFANLRLQPTTSYAVRVRGVNAAGEGAPTATVIATTQSQLPAAPTLRSATFDEGTAGVKVGFRAPADIGSSAITGYQYAVDGGAWTDLGPYRDEDGTFYNTSPLVVAPGEHTIAVRAVNELGGGAASESTDLSVPDESSTLGAPTLLSAALDNDGRLQLTFDPPAGVTGLKYQYQIGDGEWQYFSYEMGADGEPYGNWDAIAMPGEPGTYDVSIRATNGLDTSAPSNTIAVTVADTAADSSVPFLDHVDVDESGALTLYFRPAADSVFGPAFFYYFTTDGNQSSRPVGPTEVGADGLLHNTVPLVGVAPGSYEVQVRGVFPIITGELSNPVAVTVPAVPLV